jgi:predicted O-methyltransferase YrrM
VVEIGRYRRSGLWLLRGMRPTASSIDVEAEHQAMARQSFAAAGFAAGRARLIAGSARQVLPRLADGAYDMVFIDGEITDYPYCVEAAHRLLRDGGLMVVHNALAIGLTEEEAGVIRHLVSLLVRQVVRHAPSGRRQPALPPEDAASEVGARSGTDAATSWKCGDLGVRTGWRASG